MSNYKIRLLNWESVMKTESIHNLPIVKSVETQKDLKMFADSKNLEWCPNNNMFGGYYMDKNGDCYFITL